MNILLMSTNYYYATGLIHVLRRHVAGTRRVGLSDSLKAARARIERTDFDVVITELYGQHETLQDTLNFLLYIKKKHPSVNVVLLADNAASYSTLFGLNIPRFLLKGTHINEMIVSLRYLENFFIDFSQIRKRITEIESRVIDLYIRGNGVDDISRKLKLTTRSVYAIKTNAIHKLEVKNRSVLSLIFRGGCV
ncbi:response regulator transcription factor [Salmonella enterica]